MNAALRFLAGLLFYFSATAVVCSQPTQADSSCTDLALEANEGVLLDSLVQTRGRNVGLFIGNDYGTSALLSGRLVNPPKDAERLRSHFAARNYTTLCLLNATADQIMSAALISREHVLAGGMVVIYFAGHGFSFDAEARVVGFDADLEQPENLLRSSVPEGELLAATSDDKTPVVLILDSCRSLLPRLVANATNGFPQGRDPTPNSLVHYAAGQGEIVQDLPDHSNGFYAKVFPGINAEFGHPIFQVIIEVTNRLNRGDPSATPPIRAMTVRFSGAAGPWSARAFYDKPSQEHIRQTLAMLRSQLGMQLPCDFLRQLVDAFGSADSDPATSGETVAMVLEEARRLIGEKGCGVDPAQQQANYPFVVQLKQPLEMVVHGQPLAYVESIGKVITARPLATIVGEARKISDKLQLESIVTVRDADVVATAPTDSVVKELLNTPDQRVLPAATPDEFAVAFARLLAEDDAQGDRSSKWLLTLPASEQGPTTNLALRRDGLIRIGSWLQRLQTSNADATRLEVPDLNLHPSIAAINLSKGAVLLRRIPRVSPPWLDGPADSKDYAPTLKKYIERSVGNCGARCIDQLRLLRPAGQ